MFATLVGRSLCLAAFLFTLFSSATFAESPTPADMGSVTGKPVTVRKLLPVDCRVVRAFAATPIDGTTLSRDYRGSVAEYPARTGAGTLYDYNGNDGLHVTLPDDQGFDLVVLRGGARTKMVAGETQLDGPGAGRLLWEFPGGNECQVAVIKEPVKSRKVSFFETADGALAEVSFYRLMAPSGSPAPNAVLVPGGKPIETAAPQPALTPDGEDATDPPRALPEDIQAAMAERYGEPPHVAFPLIQPAASAGTIDLKKGQFVHFLAEPCEPGTALAAVELSARITPTADPARITFAVHDPLSPRRDLAWLELPIPRAGELHLTVDVPDQVFTTPRRLWLVLRCDQDVRVAPAGAPGGLFQLTFTSPEKALPEALAWRKMIMRALFGALSEPHPWSGFHPGLTREKFYASSKYARECPELFETMDHCVALGPKDDLVRQYHDRVFGSRLRQQKPAQVVPTPAAPPAGVPPWAWYPRLAWLETRRVAAWWLDHRLVPTGEFGGRVNDDTDFYQQFADLPMFGRDELTARLVDGAARLAELADQTTLRNGVNVQVTDALHAYEEGINHLGLMARWFYGDPLYLERCMESARSVEKLTIVTEDGRRHFRNGKSMGIQDLETPRPPAFEENATAALWHPALTVADYNRNPTVLKTLRHYADSWLRIMKPESRQWPTKLNVLTGETVESRKDRPFRMGEGATQAATFTYLFALTGDPRYVSPFSFYFQRGEMSKEAEHYAPDIYCLGGMDSLERPVLERLIQTSGALALLATNSPDTLLREPLRGDSPTPLVQSLHDAARFPDMHTTAEPYTDRVHIQAIGEWASRAYLGGFCGRNKYNPTHAVSWDGLGQDFAALILKNRSQGLKAAVYSYASRPVPGTMRIWALEHGRYQVATGIDTNGDFEPEGEVQRRAMTLARADAVPITLAPKAVTIITVEQVERLEPFFTRADLALAGREVEIAGNEVRGVVHNIGSSDAENVTVDILDAAGQGIASASLGRLEATLDLLPRRKSFTIRLPGGARNGWTLAVDPANRIPETYEGNNRVSLDALPAINYAKEVSAMRSRLPAK